MKKQPIAAAMQAVMGSDVTALEVLDPVAAKRTTKAEGSKAIAAAHAKKLTAAANQDATTILTATEQRQRADQSFRTVMLTRATELRRPGFAVHEVKGTHSLHDYYLSELDKALRHKRGETNASGYTRRVIADTRAVFGAVQVGSEVKVFVWPASLIEVKNSKGKVTGYKPSDEMRYSVKKPERLPHDKMTYKEHVAQREMDAAEVLTHQPKWDVVVQESRRIKSKLGFKSKTNNADDDGINPMSKGALTKLTDRITNRLGVDQCVKLMAATISETRKHVAPENHKFFDTRSGEFLIAVKRALTEAIGTGAKEATNTLRQTGTDGKRGRLQEEADGAGVDVLAAIKKAGGVTPEQAKGKRTRKAA